MTPQERFAEPVVGDAYRFGAKLIAVIITVCVFVFIGMGIAAGGFRDAAAILLFTGAAAGMCLGCYHIVAGKTRIDSEGIRQDWIFPKQYRWEEIYKAKMLRLPMATRLVLTTPRPPFKAVHAGTPELEKAFADIAAMLPGRIRPGG